MSRMIAGLGRAIFVLAGGAALLAGCTSPLSRPASAQGLPPQTNNTGNAAYPNAAPAGAYPNAAYPNAAPAGAYPNTAYPPAYPAGAYPAGAYPNAAPAGAYPNAAPAGWGGVPSGPGPAGLAPGGPPYAPPAGYMPAASPGYAGNPGPSAAAVRQGAGIVPVGATDVAPAGRDVVPAIGMGPAPGWPAGPAPVASAPPGVAGQPAPLEPAAPPDDKKKDEDSAWDWTHLAPEQTWKDLKKATGWGPDQKLARDVFQEGLALFRDKKYEEAADKFYTASWRWPDSMLEEDALFLMGECYFFSDNYSKAYDAYANLMKQHENTRYLDTVMSRVFRIGRFWEELDDKSHHWPTTPNATDKTRPWFDTAGNALGAYDMVRLHDPTGPLADSAVFASANYHFRHGEWEEAAYNYDLLRKDYPKSRFQKEAHLFGLQAKLHVYQGARYDVTPLNDADNIAKQTLAQFHGQIGDEESRVAATRANIRQQRAEREWAVAQYYDNKKQYGAARLYYRTILDKYPGTECADRARTRMQEIQNEPDNPPDHFKWLHGLFERER